MKSKVKAVVIGGGGSGMKQAEGARGDNGVDTTFNSPTANLFTGTGGGGGGSGALVSFTVNKEDLPGASSVALTMNSSVATGPAGVDNADAPFAKIGFGEITGWKNEQSINY